MGCGSTRGAPPSAGDTASATVLPEPELPKFPARAAYALARLGCTDACYVEFQRACGRVASGCGTVATMARRLGVPNTPCYRSVFYPEMAPDTAEGLPPETPLRVERLAGAAWRLCSVPASELPAVIFGLHDRDATGAVSLAEATRMVDGQQFTRGAKVRFSARTSSMQCMHAVCPRCNCSRVCCYSTACRS